MSQRPITAGLSSAGVHHIGKVTSACNSVFQVIDQQNDLGNDTYIEFVVDEASTGCGIAVQIKSGASYVQNGKFVIPADKKHLEYWRSHSLPICGIVYDPGSDTARWVDITEHLAEVSEDLTSLAIHVPAKNLFDERHFEVFRHHFLQYRTRFSDTDHFGKALSDFSELDDLAGCHNGIRALFSFHRNRPESWYYVISTIPNFNNHPLLPLIVTTLCHVPGHMDIFWGPYNIISEPVRKQAEILLRKMLSRDAIVTLVGAIEDEGGIGRGTIGQCVHCIVALTPNRRATLESIVRDASIAENSRYWVLILLVEYEQHHDAKYCAALIGEVVSLFSEDDQDRLRGLQEDLKKYGYVEFS